MKAAFPMLFRLGDRYLGPEWDSEFATPDDAVRSFVRSEPPGSVGRLIAELDRALGSGLSDIEIERLWLDELLAGFDPQAIDTSCTQWFEHIRDVLFEGREAPPSST